MIIERRVAGFARLSFLAVLAMGGAGCDENQHVEDGVGDDLEVVDRAIVVASGGWGCRTCGYTNSPICGVHPIGEFGDGTKESGAEIELAAIEDPMGTRHPAEVEQSEFTATTPAGLVYGNGLVDWKLVFQTAAGTEFTVTIMAYDEPEDWAEGHAIPTYSLMYPDPTNPDGDMLNVCPGISGDDTSVLLLTGERYDEASKTVLPHEGGWVTMACRGHALSKLKLLGYGPNDPYQSDADQRQATLKMLTADYCGGGYGYTVPGQPLAVTDAAMLHPPDDINVPVMLEALWDADGATCLNTPRHYDRDQVACVDDLPECVVGDPTDPQQAIGGGELWATMNPL